MLFLSPNSDGEIGSETLNSSQSSMSSGRSCSDDRRSSFSRLSFDGAAAPTAALNPPPSGQQLPCFSSPPRLPSKPHRSSDPAWEAIRSRSAAIGGGGSYACLGPTDFKLVSRIGSGDIGTVYLCRLRDHSKCLEEEYSAAASATCAYAMKVVDKLALTKKNKLERAATEKRILRILDHPFLPTLYADFDATPHYSCVVMEYCSGGDLHSLRHRQPGRRFSVAAARFYAAEVLLALEYLHLLGIVYRDLKPENILIRKDGHIMLSDFDLSLESTSSPKLEPLVSASSTAATSSSTLSDKDDSAGADPSCLPDGLFRTRRQPATPTASQMEHRRFVAEPVEARSLSFVGTHEYVAPEVAAGRPHGSAVDWWAYGVLLYELLYGRTPFAGPTNEATLRNIVRQPLSFPPQPPYAVGAASSLALESAARDLISGLLVKDPGSRLGSKRGAADVKTHRFFKGLNFALLRSNLPPVIPGLVRFSSAKERKKPGRVDYF